MSARDSWAESLIEYLRETAELMRERAEAATPGPWEDGDDGWDAPRRGVLAQGESILLGCCCGGAAVRPDAEHIAAADPPFMLAVADLLDDLADEWEGSPGVCPSAFSGAIQEWEGSPGVCPSAFSGAIHLARTYRRELP